MNFGFQIKIRGDEFGGDYSNGLSLANSISVGRCRKTEEDADKTVFVCDDYKVTAYHKKTRGVYKCYTEFENLSDRDLTLDLISSFCVDDVRADTIHRATSFWSAEGKMLSQRLNDLNMFPSWSNHGMRAVKFGQIGSLPVRSYFPFVCLEDSKKGDFIGAQLYCPASWQMEVFRVNEPLTVTGGLADFDYGHWCKLVHPGEKFTSPRANVAKGKSLNGVCDKLVKAQTPDISEADKDMPVIFNEYCTTWGNPSKENLEKIADTIKGTNMKYLVIDAGWFKKPGAQWWQSNGDWEVNEEMFPNGIKEVTDKIRACGFIPGIWFELEKAASLSDMFNKTEYLLYRDGVPLTVGGQRYLDMRKDICHKYLKERVIDFLRDNGFGYIKIDYNETIGVGCDGEESLGEGLRKSILGSQKFIREIRKEIPDIVIEICASGGHRLEPSWMEIASMASFSDAHECKCIPIVAANCQRMIRPEQSQIWAVIRATDDIHRIRYSVVNGFLGRLCLSGDIYDISDKHWKEILKGIDFYGRCCHIIRKGATTVIDQVGVDDYNHPEGYQAVLREYKDEALLIMHTFKGGKNPPVEKYIDGYKISETYGSELSGDFRAKIYLLKK